MSVCTHRPVCLCVYTDNCVLPKLSKPWSKYKNACFFNKNNNRFSKNPVKRPKLYLTTPPKTKFYRDVYSSSSKSGWSKNLKNQQLKNPKIHVYKTIKTSTNNWKTKPTAFRRIRLNVPGSVDAVIRSARISGRLFVRLKLGFCTFPNNNSNF